MVDDYLKSKWRMHKFIAKRIKPYLK
jgi:hypothetical protein